MEQEKKTKEELERFQKNILLLLYGRPNKYG